MTMTQQPTRAGTRPTSAQAATSAQPAPHASTTPRPQTPPAPAAAVSASLNTVALFMNATVAMVLGAQLMLLLHELGHVAGGLAFGHAGTLYPFAFLPAEEPTGAAKLVEVAAGPLLSLITGLLAVAWQPLRQGGGFWHLVWTWFGFASLMEFVGYLVITPFGAGDTAVLAEELDVAEPLRWAIIGGGILGMLPVAWAFARFVERSAGFAHKRRSWAFAFWPWIVATALCIALSLLFATISPAHLTEGEQVAVATVGAVLFVCAPMSFMVSKMAEGVPTESLRLAPWPVAGGILLSFIIAADIALAHGLPIGK